jgi:hypothetical protein
MVKLYTDVPNRDIKFAIENKIEAVNIFVYSDFLLRNNR